MQNPTNCGCSFQSSLTLTLTHSFSLCSYDDLLKKVGDVVIPEKWSLYQKQHFAKELEDGSHEIPGFQLPVLMGDGCGNGFGPDAPLCGPGEYWNYTFIYPASVPGADPNAEGIDATSEGR